ncbi:MULTISPECIES: FAD-dependent oxidoreductase [Corynebacterium]|uniref:FAD-dependent oxidoreductase n=1 Tax=Corynebacterium TaxID=1716 RepID=UPI0008A3AEA9|nr:MULTISPECIES: FAD-dependent oxidoreductase [Corynebacterium]OFU55370.1 hypothetical protein HMPREF3121_06220 [Corynebacterium sp. HMSC11E11]UBI03028.1 FAD-dependent oxidoreductase [Corynebacterium freneyi]
MTHAHVVGGGPAGWAAARHLARAGWSVDLHAGEPHHPYNRVEVSKSLLAGTAEVADHGLGAVPDGVTVHVGGRIVVKRGKLVRDSDGAELTGPVVLATGAVPRSIASLDDAHLLRTADDAVRLRESIRDGDRVEVIGAGVLGMETASSLIDAGHRVRVHDLAPEIMGRMLPVDAARWLRGVHERRGVEFALGGAAEPDGDAVAVVAIGVRPDTELAEQLGLDVDDGIVVDHLGRTSRTGLYAAGDCSTLRIGERRRRDEDLASARASGVRAATGVLVDAGDVDAPDPIDPAPPRRWSVQAGLRITTVGDVVDAVAPGAGVQRETGDHGQLIVVADDVDAGTYEAVVVRDGIVVGAASVAKRPNPRGVVAQVGRPWQE